VADAAVVYTVYQQTGARLCETVQSQPEGWLRWYSSGGRIVVTTAVGRSVAARDGNKTELEPNRTRKREEPTEPNRNPLVWAVAASADSWVASICI